MASNQQRRKREVSLSFCLTSTRVVDLHFSRPEFKQAPTAIISFTLSPSLLYLSPSFSPLFSLSSSLEVSLSPMAVLSESEKPVAIDEHAPVEELQRVLNRGRGRSSVVQLPSLAVVNSAWQAVEKRRWNAILRPIHQWFWAWINSSLPPLRNGTLHSPRKCQDWRHIILYKLVKLWQLIRSKLSLILR